MSELWIAALVALWVLVLFMGVLLAGALRQIGLFQLRLGDDLGALITDVGLERGTAAPPLEAIDVLTRRSFDLSMLARRLALLVFVTPGCLACRQLAPHLNEVVATRRDELELVVVCTGDGAECSAYAHKYGLRSTVLLDDSGAIAARYEAKMTPLAYVLDSERHVLLRGVVNNWLQVEALLDQEGVLQQGRPWTRTDAAPTAGEPVASMSAARVE